MNEPDEHADSESPTESLRWLEAEMANHVGFTVTIKTYENDYLCGRICGVRSGGVQIIDEGKNRLFCDIGIIALYCIVNPNAKTNKVKTTTKKVSKKKQHSPKASKLPLRKGAIPTRKRKKKDLEE